MKTYYDPWESETPPARKKVIQEKLKEYINFAQSNVPFYKTRLHAFDPQSPHPLSLIPLLSSAQLRSELPPASTQLLSRSPKAYTVFQSGGTTGFPKTSLFSGEEMAGLLHPNRRGFHAVGLTQEDRVANLFAVGGLYMTFIHIHQMLESWGCMNFPFSNHTTPEFILPIAKAFQINCFTGITSVVLNTLRTFYETNPEGLQINKIYFGGEHIYKADREEMKHKFGEDIQIYAPGYGTVDTWYIGYQCIKADPGVFHAHDDQSYLEIVREDPRSHCELEEPGLLTVTTFPRRLTPIIRYPVGDRAKWLEKPCECGRSTPLFELLGRGDDVLRIGFDSIDYAFIQQSVLQVKGLSGTVQIEKKRIEGKDELILRVETDAASEKFQSLKKSLNFSILESRPSLREFIENKTVWPLNIELLALGTLPHHHRTGKLIRVIDAL